LQEHNRLILNTVRDMLERGDLRQAVRTVADLHSADTAEILSQLDIADEVEILVNMDVKAAARALLEMEEPHQVEIAGQLRTGELRVFWSACRSTRRSTCLVTSPRDSGCGC